jgi:hypothetical protein
MRVRRRRASRLLLLPPVILTAMARDNGGSRDGLAHTRSRWTSRCVGSPQPRGVCSSAVTPPAMAPMTVAPRRCYFLPQSRPPCSEHGPICHLFVLILVIHANTSNGTNHIV